jgi:hypothetical protein
MTIHHWYRYTEQRGENAIMDRDSGRDPIQMIDATTTTVWLHHNTPSNTFTFART